MSLTKVTYSMVNGAVVNVLDYGAVGDGVTDDTTAIQAALTAAGEGREVFLPKGKYKVSSTLIIPKSTKLVGESQLAAFKSNLYEQLSTLYVYTGQGATTTPAVLLDLGSGVHGVCFYYPNQVAPSATTPIQFGWAIATDASKPYMIDDVTIRDVMFVNAYQGISLDRAGRFNVRDVYGDTLKEGIFVDNCYDVCRMQNVHIWTFTYVPGDNMFTWIGANGRAFNFCRVDQITVSGCFQYGRNIGFDFNDTGSAAFWGDLIGCMSDVANYPVRINKVARMRWFGGSLIPYLPSQPCVTTSSNVSTVGQGTAHVAFVGTQFHDIARCGAVIRSSTGNFNFTDCDFERSEVTVINEFGARVSVDSPKTRFGTPTRLTTLGDGANTFYNGVPNPTLSTNVTPNNFGMLAWTGGVPDNWTFLAGSSANIQQVGAGYNRLLLNSATTSVISYPLPTDYEERRSLYTIRVNVRFQDVTDAILTFHCRRDNATVQQSVRAFANFNHTQDIWYDIPIILGYDTQPQAIDIEWSTPSGPTSGYIEIAGLELYECDDSVMTQDVIDSIMRREFLNPQGYGAPISKVGGRRTNHQATAAPTTGTWVVGDTVMRYPPVAGQPKGWVCTVAGTPGTWVSLGNL